MYLSHVFTTHVNKSFNLDYYVHKYLSLLGSDNEVHIKWFLSAVGFYRGVSG